MISEYFFFMSSLPNEYLFTSEMDDSVHSLSSSDSTSTASSTSVSEKFLTIHEVNN